MTHGPTPDEVLRWMAYAISDGSFVDRRTGEVNYTALAEGAAHTFDHDEWLDDPDHWVWEKALEVEDAE